MSNVEHPKHYQLSIDLEVLDVINLVLSNEEIYAEDYQKDISSRDCFYIGNVLKYLFRADKKNGLEDYKKALCYLYKISHDFYFERYTYTERVIINKVLETIKNENVRGIIKNAIYLKFRITKKLLQDYIEEQEKQNEINKRI